MTRIVVSRALVLVPPLQPPGAGLTPTSLLPADVEPVSPQDIIDAIGEALDQQARPDLFIGPDDTPPFGRSWEYNFLHYRWHRGGQGQGPIQTRGIFTLEQWIYKTLITDRGAHPIHPNGYGLVRPFDVIGEPMAGVPYESLQMRVTDALIYHPRIEDVRDFRVESADPDNEWFEISFTVILDDESELPVTTTTLG